MVPQVFAIDRKRSTIEHSTNFQMATLVSWQNSDHICALSDGERHIGHVVKIGGRWHAFDATHSNETGDGFRSLGTFAVVETARHAVEQSYRMLPLSFAGAA